MKALDKYVTVVQQYLEAEKALSAHKSKETISARKRARQRYKRWRAHLLKDCILEKTLDAAYVEACVLVSKNNKPQ